MSGNENVGQLLSSKLPRDLLLNLQRLIPSALQRAMAAGEMGHQGHRSTLCGHARHLFLNEALMFALDECEIPHSKLRGNKVMLGNLGLVTLGRVHMAQSKWDNSRRSKTKVELCKPNYRIKAMVQTDMFDDGQRVEELTAFVVTEGAGLNGDSPIYIVVPDEKMDLRNPVFKEELNSFLQRYQKTESIIDNAKPRLKPGIQKSNDDIESQNS